MRTILNFKRSLLDPIPPQPTNLLIRTFQTGIDNDEWLALNNKIFAHHPDQGNWAMADLENRMKEPVVGSKRTGVVTESVLPCA